MSTSPTTNDRARRGDAERASFFSPERNALNSRTNFSTVALSHAPPICAPITFSFRVEGGRVNTVPNSFSLGEVRGIQHLLNQIPARAECAIGQQKSPNLGDGVVVQPCERVWSRSSRAAGAPIAVYLCGPEIGVIRSAVAAVKTASSSPAQVRFPTSLQVKLFSDSVACYGNLLELENELRRRRRRWCESR